VTRWLAALGLALFWLVAQPAPAADGPRRCTPDQVVLMTPQGAVRFVVDLAVTPAEQTRGLMFRPALGAREGMLFVYDRPRIARFWMKNTMIPLDMIFLDDAGQVTNIAARTVPYSLETHGSDGPVRAVLEVNGGVAAEIGVVPGTQAVHPAFRAAPAPHRCPPG